ncbi:hypothetical protein LXL04_021362 [Taraxacum kok-saghyz]
MRLKRHKSLPILAFISGNDLPAGTPISHPPKLDNTTAKPASACATVEDMGNELVGVSGGVDSWKQSLKVRRSIEGKEVRVRGKKRKKKKVIPGELKIGVDYSLTSFMDSDRGTSFVEMKKQLKENVGLMKKQLTSFMDSEKTE